ncbi:MAG: Gfo/Idh/MocA family oxidoreductase [Gemmatimonadota bacterium]|nr:Gfo/Idh/MocA family oxidoreductase [Gemmatimonadota bacterium]
MTDAPLQPVKTAVIGPGRMGGLYARILDQLALTRLVAVCGYGEVKARRVAIESGVPFYTGARFRDMFADHPEIEAVVVATSEWAHADPVGACLESGKHVLVEKPMATSPSDAVRMVHEAGRAGVHLMVCHSLRFDPRFAAMRQAVSRGDVGEVLHIYSRRASQPEAVDRVLGRFPLAYWLLPHDIDLALWTCGSAVDRVRAYARSGGSRRQDLIVVVMTFECGALAVLENVWGSPTRAGRPQNQLFTVRGTAGVVEVLPYETGVAVYRDDDVAYPDTSVAPDVHGQTVGMSRSLIRHFAGAVRDLWKPVITPRDGLAVVRIASAIDASLKEGREIAMSTMRDV